MKSHLQRIELPTGYRDYDELRFYNNELKKLRTKVSELNEQCKVNPYVMHKFDIPTPASFISLNVF